MSMPAAGIRDCCSCIRGVEKKIAKTIGIHSNLMA